MESAENRQEGILRKNMPTLVILTISGAFVYALPYFRNYYYDTFLEVFRINDIQMGSLGSIYGITSFISFCIGGFCADRWSIKYLLSLSLTTTGLLGLILLTHPPYPIVFLIHLLWGFSCVLTFWNALIIAIRSLASSHEQGRAFGFYEGGRGLVNIVQSAFVLSLFGYLSKNKNAVFALNSIILTYSLINIILGITVFFMLKDVHTSENKEKKFINTEVLKKVAKMPTTWLSGFIIFTSYAVIISYYYITPFSTAVFGLTAVKAAALGYLSQYCRPVGCFVSGFVADKIGSSKMMLYLFVILTFALVGIIMIPGEPSLLWFLIVLACALYMSMYGIQSMHFAILEEGDYPLEIMGTASAIIMPFGYGSEIFMPSIAGFCLDKWPGAPGYRVFFIVLLSMCFLGMVSAFLWRKILKLDVKECDESVDEGI